MDEKQDKLLRKIWIVILLSPFIVGLIVSINVVDITISNDWIGFYGTIIGGLVTYFSIYMSMKGVRGQLMTQKEANDLTRYQLNNEKIKIEEERRLSVRAYINEFSGDSKGAISYLAVMFDDHRLEEHTYQDDIILNIKNIGLGPIISLKVIGMKSFQAEFLTPFHEETKSLEKDGIMIITISYMHSQSFLSNNQQVILEYYDILDNLYTQSITFTVLKKDGRLEKTIINNISKQELITSGKKIN
ncbi:hypothetical protein MHI12_07675 [Paenibacillus sp. FSL H8-0280]|uniref:hypothetical protein n=1 Tax=Paenibacillus sp. FSL H8-0280 TaxID=2921382 RepID=UPI003255AD3E